MSDAPSGNPRPAGPPPGPVPTAPRAPDVATRPISLERQIAALQRIRSRAETVLTRWDARGSSNRIAFEADLECLTAAIRTLQAVLRAATTARP